MIRQRIHQAALPARKEALSLLESLVGINSYSGNAEGVNGVGDLVLERLPAVLDHRCPADPAGIRHHILSTPVAEKGDILLVGHLDTVYPPVLDPGRFRKVDSRVIGPGTADMKGGIVVLVQALRLLDQIGLLGGIPLRCLFNGDEETGSAFSSGLMKGLAPSVSCGLVFECGGVDGAIVDRRRGVGRYELVVKGRAQHAGVKEGAKASALVEMARQVLALEALNDEQRQITVNVGTVQGGRATNIVPDHASAEFEIRFWDEEAEKDTARHIAEIASPAPGSGCTVQVRQLHRTPCMVPAEGTDDLVDTVRTAARELGQTIAVEKRGGASDGNLLSSLGVPVVDGLGPIGDLDHSPDEYIVEKSLYERIELTALVLCRLAGIKG